MKNFNSKGFTIVEVLIATSVFSFGLLLISVSFIEVSKLYRQGITQRRLQQSVRFITDDIGRSGRPAELIEADTSTDPTRVTFINPSTQDTVSYCFYSESFGDTNYRQDVRKFVNSTGRCNNFDGIVDPLEPLDSGESMLEPGIALLSNVISLIGSGDSVLLSVTLGPEGTQPGGPNSDLLDGSNRCDLQSKGRQYCAVLTFEVSVTTRGASDF